MEYCIYVLAYILIGMVISQYLLNYIFKNDSILYRIIQKSNEIRFIITVVIFWLPVMSVILLAYLYCRWFTDGN